MIVEIILLIFILWIYATFSSKNSNFTNCKDNGIIDEFERDEITTLKYLRRVIDTICLELNITEIFDLKRQNTKTFAENNIIYVVIFDKTNELYELNTIVYYVVHVLTHLVIKSETHESKFIQMQKKILTIVKNYKFYDPEISLDKNYPCLTCLKSAKKN